MIHIQNKLRLHDDSSLLIIHTHAKKKYCPVYLIKQLHLQFSFQIKPSILVK